MLLLPTRQLPGLGKVSMWGMSPACDLLETIEKQKMETNENVGIKNEINVLMIGQCDIRHSLKTLTTHWDILKKNNIRINFYVVETSLELYARQILFWAIALEPLNKFGLHEKTVQFMEIFGNILIRPQTKRTLLNFTDKLIQVVTEDKLASKQLQSLFDFSEMKFRERDGIVEVFKFWKNFSTTSSFDMRKHWDFRLRNYLTTRYDARFGVFDWDYHMKLMEKGISIIGSGEYKNWRNTGIAFPEFDSHYSQPNLTLAAASEISGLPGIRSTYWGDIVTGPFICHGIESEDKSLFEKSGGIFKKKSYDVTFNNLEKLFSITSKLNAETEITDDDDNENESIHENIKIHFVSFSNFMTIPLKSKYSEFFDIIYFGNNMVQHILPHFKPIFAQNAIILAENARYALEFRPEQEKLFTTKLNELALNIGLESINDINNESDKSENETTNIQPSIVKFMMKSQKSYEKSTEINAGENSAINYTESLEDVITITSDVRQSGDTDTVGSTENVNACIKDLEDSVEKCPKVN